MIREVTETLVELIQRETPDLGEWVTPISLHEDATLPGTRLAVCLYAIDEHTHARNRPMEYDGDRYRRPPAMMRLSYMIAFFGGDDSVAHLDEQQRLDRVLQVFHNYPTITPTDMSGSLGESVDKLTVRMWSPPIEERNEIWTGFGRSMRLALFYQVDAVPITTTEAGGPPITSQQIDFGELVS